MRRAAHQVLDRPPVFEDPLAVRILGPDAGALPAEAPGLRAFLAVRSRYAEDELANAVARGVRQYVVLGAGLDTFAFRNPHAGLRVFEVDHPATQEWKRDLLRAADIRISERAVFVPVDFERQSFESELIAAGFHGAEPAFFSWLGVTPYLTDDAFTRTISGIGGMPRDTGVVFDYAIARSALPPAEQAALDSLSARVARAGEPFRLFFDPRELQLRLLSMGFTSMEDLGADALNARYFRERADGLKLRSAAGRLVRASIDPSAPLLQFEDA
jgi:methyltransferase (TIGR00027 family)